MLRPSPIPGTVKRLQLLQPNRICFVFCPDPSGLCFRIWDLLFGICFLSRPFGIGIYILRFVLLLTGTQNQQTQKNAF